MVPTGVARGATAGVFEMRRLQKRLMTRPQTSYFLHIVVGIGNEPVAKSIAAHAGICR
jgi:hypothetical protein